MAPHTATYRMTPEEAQRVCCEKRGWTFPPESKRYLDTPTTEWSSPRLLTLPVAVYQCRSDWCPPTEFNLAILDWCASKSSLWVRTQQVHRTFVRVKARRCADPPAWPREQGSASSLVFILCGEAPSVSPPDQTAKPLRSFSPCLSRFPGKKQSIIPGLREGEERNQREEEGRLLPWLHFCL